MNKLNQRLYLKESSISNGYELFHKFAEKLIFFRWTFFKNRPRSTFLLVRSLLVNSLIFGTYYAIFSRLDFLLLGIEVDPILLFVASVITGYWNMSSSFGQKTNYLSQLYNEIIRASANDKIKEAKMLKLNFCTQLLTMDLWSHRLYSWVFVQTLEESALWSVEQNLKVFENESDFYTKANNHKLTVAEARAVLLNHLMYLQHETAEKQERHLKAV